MTAVAPDGSPVELFRHLPPGEDLAVVAAAVGPRPAAVLDLGSGAGRLANPLAEAGHEVTAVDEEPAMLAAVRGCRTVLTRIQDLDLGRGFDVVLLAGNLVNVDDDRRRAAYLRTCRRNVAAHGSVLVQRVDPVWAATAQAFESEHDGVAFQMRDVVADGEVLAATVRYRTAEVDATHRFHLRVLDDAAIEGLLHGAGLRLAGWLDARATWLQAVPADG